MDTLPELTFEEFLSLPYAYWAGFHTDRGAVRMYRNEKHGLWVEMRTPKNKHGEWGTGVRTYMVDNIPKEFLSPAEQYEAYMRKVCEVDDE